MHATHRYTTREVAQDLGCRPADALTLLKAAGVARTRCGASYLWSAEDVRRLLAAVRSDGEQYDA